MTEETIHIFSLLQIYHELLAFLLSIHTSFSMQCQEKKVVCLGIVLPEEVLQTISHQSLYLDLCIAQRYQCVSQFVAFPLGNFKKQLSTHNFLWQQYSKLGITTYEMTPQLGILSRNSLLGITALFKGHINARTFSGH